MADQTTDEGLEPVVRNVDDGRMEVLTSWPIGEIAYRLRDGFEVIPSALVDAVLRIEFDPHASNEPEVWVALRSMRAYREDRDRDR